MGCLIDMFRGKPVQDPVLKEYEIGIKNSLSTLMKDNVIKESSFELSTKLSDRHKVSDFPYPLTGRAVIHFSQPLSMVEPEAAVWWIKGELYYVRELYTRSKWGMVSVTSVFNVAAIVFFGPTFLSVSTVVSIVAFQLFKMNSTKNATVFANKHSTLDQLKAVWRYFKAEELYFGQLPSDLADKMEMVRKEMEERDRLINLDQLFREYQVQIECIRDCLAEVRS